MRLGVVFMVMALLVLLGTPPLVVAEEEPTRDDVRKAVRGYGDFAQVEASRTQLRAWGDAAVPHLLALAKRPVGVFLGSKLVRAARDIGTESAADVLVTILEGKTYVRGRAVLDFTYPYDVSRGIWKHLRKHPRLKPAVLRYAKSSTRSFLSVCAAMGWKDLLPTIRPMLDDPDLDVREAAAEAVRELSGESVAIDRPAISFPAERLVPGLLGEAQELPRRGFRRAEFVAAMPWFDERPHLLYAFSDSGTRPRTPREFRVATADAGVYEVWPLPYETHALEIAPTSDGKTQLLALVTESEDRPTSWKTVVALAPDGTLRWRRELPQRFLKDIALLYEKDGPVGVAVAAGGETGIVAVDPDGEALWDVPNRHVMYEVHSHPRLPGSLLAVTGKATLYRHAGKDVDVPRGPLQDSLAFFNHGVLFPAADGRAAVVVAGELHARDVPVVRRLDASGKTVWEARLPHGVGGLALLEPAGAPRLLAVTTVDGTLYLLDEAGALRWTGKLPNPKGDKEVATYQLVAGEIGPGQYAVLIGLLHGAHVFRLDLEALKRAEDK